MALPLFNWNGGQVIAANGNFCAIVVPITQPANQNAGANGSPMIDLVTYCIVPAATTTGTINFQELMPDRVTWVTLTSTGATTITLSGTANPVSSGFIQGPFIGVRLIVAALAISTITSALLKGTIRS
jgi:hypothetical protein